MACAPWTRSRSWLRDRTRRTEIPRTVVAPVCRNRMMRTVASMRCPPWALAVFAAASLLFAAGGCGLGGGDDAHPSGSAGEDRVVATVDGSRVRADEVQLVNAERRFTGEDDKASSALDEAIERSLMRREAARLRVRADEAVIGRRLDELETAYGGAAALEDVLRRAGMSRSQLRQSVTDGVLRESLRDAKFSRTRATPRNVSAFYRRNLRRLFTRPASVHLGAIQVRTERVARTRSASFARAARSTRSPASCRSTRSRGATAATLAGC